MSLIEDWKEPCVIMKKNQIPDREGGRITAWMEGTTFEATITFDNSMEARIAEKEGVTSLYTVTTDKNFILEYHDVLKRKNDGQIFRITSNGEDMKTPNNATLQFRQVTAERWELTT